MVATDLIDYLSQTTVASSAAVVLALLLRRPLRAAFGAAVGYGTWTLVPAAVIATLLPVVPAQVATHAVTVATFARSTAAMLSRGPIDNAWIACMVWASGMGLMALHFMRQQRRFVRALGRLSVRDDGLLQAEANAGLPAAVGLLRPRIVLPADFAERYSIEQQSLMRMHERTHIERGDLYVNAIVALLRCVFWFNPLLHVAARPFRQDQELACDQHVIACRPRARRAYGEAMFNTQFAAHVLPLGCHWLAFGNGRSHPLKERIAMLKQPVPSLSRFVAGSAVVVTLAVAVAGAAWAAQPAKASVLPQAADIAPANVDNPMPAPTYPKTALANHVGGRVDLLIDVDARGKPVRAVVAHADPAGVFDQASIDAAMRWTFQPAIERGQAVPGRISVPITFLPDPVAAVH